MKKHSARVAPLSACNSPVLTLTKVEGEERPRDPPGPAEVQAPAGVEAGGKTSRPRWTCSRARLKKTLWGVAVVLCVCASWAGSTQLARLTFRTFDAPFTLTWFATNWNFLFFPLYYAGRVCKSTEKQSVKQRYRALLFTEETPGRTGSTSRRAQRESLWHSQGQEDKTRDSRLLVQDPEEENRSEPDFYRQLPAGCSCSGHTGNRKARTLAVSRPGPPSPARKTGVQTSQQERLWDCCGLFGENGLTLKVFFTKAAPFGVLWTLTNYLYLHAIKKINTTDVSVLFCCNKAFVFLLSWTVLRDRFMGVRIVAAILAIAGIVMMTYADGFHSHSVIGIALVVGSASMSALYKVLFKLLLGSAKFGEAALFLSILAVFNAVFVTCVPVVLYFTKVEHWSSFADIPWGNLCGFSLLLLTFNIVLNFGIAVTYPTLMSLGIVLSVPVNAVVDHYTSEIVFNGVRVIAIVIIGLGFLLLLLPEEWDVWLITLLTRLKVRKKEETAESGGDLNSGPQSRGRRARPSFAR
ncbi:solute carrier family 35 member F3 isoform X1 [Dipodomys merriami]|uniref:solute carrier family 35 member F3 isoform X1 n=1 Tax=Dipodomys merriami TaxID=94247 RepID=UPI003855BB7C